MTPVPGPSDAALLRAELNAEREALRRSARRVGTVTELRELLAFRHRFRNSYGEDLDPAKLDALAALAPRTVEHLENELGAFDRFLEKLAAA